RQRSLRRSATRTIQLKGMAFWRNWIKWMGESESQLRLKEALKYWATAPTSYHTMQVKLLPSPRKHSASGLTAFRISLVGLMRRGETTYWRALTRWKPSGLAQ